LKGIELWNLRALCEKLEIDQAEIDSSLSYFENKQHLREISRSPLSEAVWESEFERYQAYLESGESQRIKPCPKCGEHGSGLHRKWVLNEQGRRYYPYYWFAHSIRKNGHYAVKWCYVRKAIALAML
jgi:hypothetical protein